MTAANPADAATLARIGPGVLWVGALLVGWAQGQFGVAELLIDAVDAGQALQGVGRHADAVLPQHGAKRVRAMTVRVIRLCLAIPRVEPVVIVPAHIAAIRLF